MYPAFKRNANFTDDVNFDDLITLQEIRDDLGLFNDDSQDSSIKGYLRTSLRECEKILGVPVISRNVTNYYPSFAKRMELSQEVPDSDFAIVSVSYRNANLVATNVDTTNVHHDYSAGRSALLFLDPKLPDDLSEDIANPVEIVFSGAGIRAGNEAIDSVRQALKWHVNLLYFQRASADVKQYAIDHIEAILDSFIDTDNVYIPDC